MKFLKLTELLGNNLDVRVPCLVNIEYAIFIGPRKTGSVICFNDRDFTFAETPSQIYALIAEPRSTSIADVELRHEHGTHPDDAI